MTSKGLHIIKGVPEKHLPEWLEGDLMILARACRGLYGSLEDA